MTICSQTGQDLDHRKNQIMKSMKARSIFFLGRAGMVLLIYLCRLFLCEIDSFGGPKLPLALLFQADRVNTFTLNRKASSQSSIAK